MKKDKPSFDCDEVNFVLERNQLFSLLNKAYDEHDSMKSKDCQKRELDFVDIAPRGCGFIYTKVGCKNCKFKTESRPLYAEVERSWDGSSQERGPKSAKGNVRVMMTIQNTPMSITDLQLACSAIGFKPLSATQAKKLSTKVGKITEELNVRDMQKWAEDTKSILIERGVSSKYIDKIDVAMDVRYDNSGLKSNITPGTAATAATGIMCDTLTDDPKVIEMFYSSKRCYAGTILERLTGTDPRCGEEDKHDGCCASIPKSASITEKEMAKQMASRLHMKTGQQIIRATTDGDAQMFNGVVECYKEKEIDTKDMGNDRDLTHLGRSQRKAVQAIKFHKYDKKDSKGQMKITPEQEVHSHSEHLDSTYSFVKGLIQSVIENAMERCETENALACGAFGINGGTDKKWSYKAERACKAAFAHDVESRCSKTYKAISDHYNNDKERMKANIDDIRSIMMKCYDGNHRRCRSVKGRLTGCQGNDSSNWFKKSTNLKNQRIFYTDFNKEEKEKIDDIIKLKISAAAVDYLHNNYVSSGCESVFHSVNKADPKNETRCKTGVYRNHCAILSVNNHADKAAEMMFAEAKCDLPANSHTRKAFRDKAENTKYQKKYRRLSTTKKRQFDLKVKANKRYYDNIRTKEGPRTQSDYAKHGREMAELAMLACAADKEENIVNVQLRGKRRKKLDDSVKKYKAAKAIEDQLEEIEERKKKEKFNEKYPTTSEEKPTEQRAPVITILESTVQLQTTTVEETTREETISESNCQKRTFQSAFEAFTRKEKKPSLNRPLYPNSLYI